jgi:chemotaxis protein MotB
MQKYGRRTDSDHAENHERWLVSYADFITLMFAFFVVMFASAEADKAQAKSVSEAVTRALQEDSVKQKLSHILGGTPDKDSQGNAQVYGLRSARKSKNTPEKLAELAPSLEMLSRELQDDIKAGRVRLNLEPRGLIISLTQAAFFPSGGDQVAPESYPSVEKVARVIKMLPNPVRLEGHTDSVPISNTRFHSNWELSAARSIAMLQLLNHRFGIPAERMAVVGYAETVAVDSNATENGRARNRRVDITILNQAAALNESRASH